MITQVYLEEKDKRFDENNQVREDLLVPRERALKILEIIQKKIESNAVDLQYIRIFFNCFLPCFKKQRLEETMLNQISNLYENEAEFNALLNRITVTNNSLQLTKNVLKFYQDKTADKKKFKEFFGVFITTIKGLSLREVSTIVQINL